MLHAPRSAANIRALQTLALPLLCVALLGLLSPGVAHAAPRCFPEAAPAITDCIDGRFATYWAEQGGLPVFGYPIGPAHPEQTSAGLLAIQLFERARLELHPENARPYDVLLGRLGADLLARQGRDWTTLPKGDPAAPHYFAQTGHAIGPQFWSYWSSHGLEFDRQPGKRFDESLALFGIPISEAQVETNPTDGKPYLTQWFERARFEYHPENVATESVILLGLLQRELMASGDSPTDHPAPTPQNSQPGGFIEAQGSKLTRLGMPVRLKGVNYYPQWRPWAEMWRGWDGPQIERELRLARDQLGINAVRVLLPYNFSGAKGGDGKVTSALLRRLRELVQIAGSLDLRLIVTLFDFSHDFPPDHSADEATNLAYLRAVVGAFADDERIFAWDLHNEPDHYGRWKDGDPQAVLSWLGRMADAVHYFAPRQLVTVGMGQPASLWLPGPDGRTAIDYSDVVSVHIYDAAAAARQLDDVRAHTAKPILVEEFGWPTGPACVENYTETTQVQLYRDVLAAASDRAAGVFAWTLRDYDDQQTDRWDSREEHFGLYRPDGSLKPAAQELIAAPAEPLPSATTTNLPLSSTNPHLPDHSTAPLAIPGSGHTVKGAFRRAWELFGGQGSFGLPLTEAFVLPDSRGAVQYFEAAELELHLEAADEPGFDALPEVEQIARLIRPAQLGSRYTAGRPLFDANRALQGTFLAFYDSVNGAWRLGAAISPELVEQIDGAPTRVQYFERGRLEWNAATQAVVIGPLGAWAWDMQCQKP
jgi:cellulase (glycosyl hydrolase family 5)